MKPFSSLRRDFLRSGGLGVAGVALPSVALAASDRHGPTEQQPVFNVRSYGAAGDGKTLDTAAVNRAIEAAEAAAAAWFFFQRAAIFAFRFT